MVVWNDITGRVSVVCAGTATGAAIRSPTTPAICSRHGHDPLKFHIPVTHKNGIRYVKVKLFNILTIAFTSF